MIMLQNRSVSKGKERSEVIGDEPLGAILALTDHRWKALVEIRIHDGGSWKKSSWQW
jgi:hypothetical protein